MSFCSC